MPSAKIDIQTPDGVCDSYVSYPDQVACVASFHAGRLAAETPDSVLFLVPKIKAELYLAHADNDQSMPREDIEKFHQTLKDAHIKFEDEVYNGAAHGYTMKDIPAYNEAALQRHWTKLAAFFERI